MTVGVPVDNAAYLVGVGGCNFARREHIIGSDHFFRSSRLRRAASSEDLHAVLIARSWLLIGASVAVGGADRALAPGPLLTSGHPGEFRLGAPWALSGAPCPTPPRPR